MTSDVGTELFKSLDKLVLSEHLALTLEQWEPTPFMVDVDTTGREEEIKRWCYQCWGGESSPMHNRTGIWRQSFVTIRGMSWFGFTSETTMNQFLERFP